jgi:hypothetical protein
VNAARAWLLLPLLALAIAACGEPVEPSATPTPEPLAAPTIVVGSFTGINGRWTFNASVHPRGSPTDIVLEYHLGPEGSGEFDQHVDVKTGLVASGTVTAQLVLADDAVFCVRFTATNEVGTTSSEPRCFGARPSGVIVVPVPAGSASPSAAP